MNLCCNWIKSTYAFKSPVFLRPYEKFCVSYSESVWKESTRAIKRFALRFYLLCERVCVRVCVRVWMRACVEICKSAKEVREKKKSLKSEKWRAQTKRRKKSCKYFGFTRKIAFTRFLCVSDLNRLRYDKECGACQRGPSAKWSIYKIVHMRRICRIVSNRR